MGTRWLTRSKPSAQYDLRHGEAVAVGLVYAARLARRLGRIGDDRVEQHDRVVSAYDLPSRLPAGADPVELVAVMGRDKKVTGGGLTFVLDGPVGARGGAGCRGGGCLVNVGRAQIASSGDERLR